MGLDLTNLGALCLCEAVEALLHHKATVTATEAQSMLCYPVSTKHVMLPSDSVLSTA